MVKFCLVEFVSENNYNIKVNQTPWKILLIEDDEDDYFVTRKYLAVTHHGPFQLEWVQTSEAGLNAIRGGIYDAVLVDYYLGPENGLDLIRQAVDEGCDYPFILLTGRGSYDLDMETMKAGAADYLSKEEYSPALLERTLRYAIERKRVEAERERLLNQLESERRRLSTIITNAPSAILVTDAEGKIILSNPAADTLFGFPIKENPTAVASMAVQSGDVEPQFFHVNGLPFIRRDMPLTRSALYGETTINMEMIFKSPRQIDHYLLINSAPLLDKTGKVTGAIGLIQDITQRKKVEEELRKAKDELEQRVQERTRDLQGANEELRSEIAERKRVQEDNAGLLKDLEKALQDEQRMHQQLVVAEKHAAMSRMMASVAHEINNPIQTIQNCLFLAQQDFGQYSGDQNSNAGEYLDMGMAEAKRIARLVEQLRQIYRPPRVSRTERILIENLLAEVKSLISPHLQHQKVLWEHTKTNSRAAVLGSSDQIKQVFINISLNAIEAMQPQGGTLIVSTQVSRSRGEVGIRFKDSGPGIPKAEISKLFEPFYTTKDTGTGLGLPICFEIVKNHDGRIEVKSRPGNGASFTIWLPLLNHRRTKP